MTNIYVMLLEMSALVIEHVKLWETLTWGRGSCIRGLLRVNRSVNDNQYKQEEKAKQQENK
jgi:hypothetical protein